MLFEQPTKTLLTSVSSCEPINVKLILNGRNRLNNSTNKQIFEHVYVYIKYKRDVVSSTGRMVNLLSLLNYLLNV